MIDESKALDLLSPGSPVAEGISGYEPRSGQEEMISSICEAVNQQRFTVIEAGTGIGKSFAYLIPLILAAGEMEDEHVIVATGTINLQFQLYEKDLPLLISRIDPAVTTALLMGRGNYLCLRRLFHEAQQQPLMVQAPDSPLGRVHAWARETAEGIRSELEDAVPWELWNRVCSDADFCLGHRCPERGQCFVNRARKRASESRIVVVNHHVLYSDISLKLEGDSFDEDGLLPVYRTVVCDEAHRIEDSARQYFSQILSKAQILTILSQLWNTRSGRDQGLLQRLKGYSADPRAWEDYPPIQQRLTAAAAALEEAVRPVMGRERRRWIRPDEQASFRQVTAGMEETANALADMIRLLERIGESIEEEQDESVSYMLTLFAGQRRKLQGIQEVCGHFGSCFSRRDAIFWIERWGSGRSTEGFRFCITPYSASAMLRDALYDRLDSFIAVSATLAVNGSFETWKKAMGLSDRSMLEHIIPSPFDYKHNVMLAVPTDAPPVETMDAYREYLISVMEELITLCEGRTLVLFTSFQLLKEVYEGLSGPLAESGIESLAQLPGSDRNRLLAAFRQDNKCVLFATDSFWEGVDIPGEALTQVIITRLPFQVPADPVYQARQERIKEEGGNPFMEMAVPRAAMKLKQGFGRLIRKTDDRGIVVITDKRLLTKFYGSLLLGSLPETYQVFTDRQGIVRSVEGFLF